MQPQRHLAVTLSDERNPFADKDRDNAYDEVIDLAFVQKRRDDPSAAHHPDVLALHLAESLGKGANGFVDEINARRCRWRRRLSREDVGRSVRIEPGADLYANFVTLPAQELRINRAHKP